MLPKTTTIEMLPPCHHRRRSNTSASRTGFELKIHRMALGPETLGNEHGRNEVVYHIFLYTGFFGPSLLRPRRGPCGGAAAGQEGCGPPAVPHRRASRHGGQPRGTHAPRGVPTGGGRYWSTLSPPFLKVKSWRTIPLFGSNCRTTLPQLGSLSAGENPCTHPAGPPDTPALAVDSAPSLCSCNMGFRGRDRVPHILRRPQRPSRVHCVRGGLGSVSVILPSAGVPARPRAHPWRPVIRPRRREGGGPRHPPPISPAFRTKGCPRIVSRCYSGRLHRKN